MPEPTLSDIRLDLKDVTKIVIESATKINDFHEDLKEIKSKITDQNGKVGCLMNHRAVCETLHKTESPHMKTPPVGKYITIATGVIVVILAILDYLTRRI